jgi:hypothetical protein
MHVRRLGSVAREEEEPIRTAFENGPTKTSLVSSRDSTRSSVDHPSVDSVGPTFGAQPRRLLSRAPPSAARVSSRCSDAGRRMNVATATGRDAARLRR